MKHFKLPQPFGDNVSFTKLDIWRYLLQIYNKPITSKPDYQIVTDYLESIGFVSGQDSITEQEYKILGFAVETYLRTQPKAGSKVYDFAELFYSCDMRQHLSVSFGVYQDYKLINGSRYQLTSELKQLIELSGWLYTPHPDNTYFEIINGILVSKYQTILGSRNLAFIKV